MQCSQLVMFARECMYLEADMYVRKSSLFFCHLEIYIRKPSEHVDYTKVCEMRVSEWRGSRRVT